MAGASAGIISSTTRRASVPPAEAPMAIRRSVVRKLEASLGKANRVADATTASGRRASGRTRAWAAALTLLTISWA